MAHFEVRESARYNGWGVTFTGPVEPKESQRIVNHTFGSLSQGVLSSALSKPPYLGMYTRNGSLGATFHRLKPRNVRRVTVSNTTKDIIWRQRFLSLPTICEFICTIPARYASLFRLVFGRDCKGRANESAMVN